LDKRDGFTTGKRNRAYQLFCEFTSHPTYGGSKLITKDNLAKIGPFFDENKIKNTLFELTKQANHAVGHFICHFNDLSEELQQLTLSYVRKSKQWCAKYLR
jgi:hypothetical protein